VGTGASQCRDSGLAPQRKIASLFCRDGAPRNDDVCGWAHGRSFSRRVSRPSLAGRSPSKPRGRRECRALASPMAACNKARGSHHRFSRTSRHSPRNGFTAYSALSPVLRAFWPPLPARRSKRHSKRDTSVGVSGPRGLTVRHSVSRLRASAPDTATAIAPRLHVRDDRETPLFDEAGWQEKITISEKTKVKYFCAEGWTRVIGLKVFAKFIFRRTRIRAAQGRRDGSERRKSDNRYRPSRPSGGQADSFVGEADIFAASPLISSLPWRRPLRRHDRASPARRSLGAASNYGESLCEPTRPATRRDIRSVGISTFTTADHRIHALTVAPRIKPASIFLRSARRPNPAEALLVDAEFLFRQPGPVQLFS
jgi:hypothetical protein